MKNGYFDLIAQEREKIKVLRAKIEACEHRIAALQIMLTEDDELDELLARKVGGGPVVEKQQKTDTDQEPTVALGSEIAPPTGTKESKPPQRVLSAKTLKLLRFADTHDKSVAEFFEFARANNLMDNRARVRNFLNLYKANYGLLESSRQGYFRLSDRGVAYLESLEDRSSNESSSEEAPTSAT